MAAARDKSAPDGKLFSVCRKTGVLWCGFQVQNNGDSGLSLPTARIGELTTAPWFDCKTVVENDLGLHVLADSTACQTKGS